MRNAVSESCVKRSGTESKYGIYIYIYIKNVKTEMRELVFPLPLNDSTAAAVRRDERLGIELWPQGLKWWALQLCMGIKDMKKKTKIVFFFLFVAKENNEITIRNDNIVGSKVIWSASLLIFLFS